MSRLSRVQEITPALPTEEDREATAELLRRRIGAILVDNGHLDIDQAEQVLAVQRQRGGLFGRVAIDLGFIDEGTVRLALGRQSGAVDLLPGDRARLDGRLREAMREPSVAAAMRQLRTHLDMRCFTGAQERRALAVVSLDPRDGRSTAVAHLALLLGQTARRVLVLDTSGEGGQRRLLGEPGHPIRLQQALGTPTLLSRVGSSYDGVDVALLDQPADEPLPADAMAGPAMAMLIGEAVRRFDVVLIDTPAISSAPQVVSLAVRTGSVLVVARMGRSRLSALDSLRRQLAEPGVEVVATLAGRY